MSFKRWINNQGAPYLILIFSIILGYQNCSPNNLKGGYAVPGPSTTAASLTNNPGVLSIFRSVGPNNSSPLSCGSTIGTCLSKGALTINGMMATFATALPNNVGVGDAVVFDCSGNLSLGAGDCVAFITSRIDSQHYMIQNPSGGNPKPYVGGFVWEIFRAYTSLADAVDVTVGGTENTAISSIDPTLGNFDNWTGGTDLVTANKQLNIALYADGVDTKPLTIGGFQSEGGGGWITSPQNNLRIYTPYLPTEVGASQRHNGGVMGLQGYELTVNCAGCSAISIYDVDLTLEGLQIFEDIPSVAATPGGSSAIYVQYDTILADLTIRDNLVQGADPTSASQAFYGVHIPEETAGSNIYIYNNIIYNFKNSLAKGYAVSSSASSSYTVYVYNNTTYNSDHCFANGTASVMVAKNNIANLCAVADYSGTFDQSSIDNISDDLTSPNMLKRSEAVVFMTTVTTSYDLRLGPKDTFAKSQGVDLSADPALPFDTDVASVVRPSGLWSIGASQ